MRTDPIRPQPRPGRRVVAVVLALGLVLAACGKDKDSSSPESTTTAAAGASTTAAATVDGSITVFAAASLTEAFTTLGSQFEAAHPGSKVRFNFDSSGVLADSIDTQGAPADVFASADTKSMAMTTKAGKVAAPSTFARNKLEILVRTGNPKHITSVKDFDRSGISFVLCNTKAPCGKYGAQLLAAQKVSAQPKSLEENVKAVVSRVSLHEVDAGIVYQSDAQAAEDETDGVTIPDAQNLVATYPIGVVKASKERETAAAFVAYVESAAGQKVLQGDGFLAPS